MTTCNNSRPLAAHKPHRGEPVQVGPYTVYLGGTQHFQPGDADSFDVLVPLTDTPLAFGVHYAIDGDGEYPEKLLRGLPPLTAGKSYDVLAATMVDFSPPPANWGDFLREKVVPLLAEGKKLLFFCIGSHGRTGTLIASLIAILEPEEANPVMAARERHCRSAVETKAQGAAIFALKGEELPVEMANAFHY